MNEFAREVFMRLIVERSGPSNNRLSDNELDELAEYSRRCERAVTRAEVRSARAAADAAAKLRPHAPGSSPR